MNAVNLIPGDRKRVTVSVSPMTLGVIGGLVVVLAAAVLYVLAVNDVRTRKSELGRVTANAASWQAAANSYASYVTDADQQKQQLADIQQLVTGRFPWPVLLSQIGGVMPANAALSSLQATSPSADTTAAVGAATPASATTPTTPTTQAVQITGCAASQSAVASTMVALGRVHGVGSVALASTSNTTAGATGSGSSSAGSASSGSGCPFPVNFTLSLVLAPSASSTGTPGSTTPASSTAAPTTTRTSSTAATSSTGSAQ
jgi:Tfp pilus assembly protein PilN